MRYLFPLSPYNQQRQWEKPIWAFPCHLAAYATYLRNEGHEVEWDSVSATNKYWIGDTAKVIKDDYQIDVPFSKLPYPDRILTDAKNPRWQSYGNYKFHPATHMMASNLCWWGKCTFCIDTKKLEEGEPQQTRFVSHVVEEIDDLISQGYKEVFDDSGTFPIGKWLEEFCAEMMKNGRNKKIKIGCNMKPLHLDYRMMKEAGFRFILVGVESVNQKTLDTIKKGQHQVNVRKNLKDMADAGLEPHITSMTSYPWETEAEERNTIEFFKEMLRKGYAKTGQVSIYSPPRTAPDPNSIGHSRVPLYYDVYKHPEFWYNKIKDIKCIEDVSYLFRGGRLVFEEHWRKLCHGLRLKLNSNASNVEKNSKDCSGK